MTALERLRHHVSGAIARGEAVAIAEQPAPHVVFAELARIAAPIVQHYHNDIAVHDRRLIEAAGPRDSFLWAPYSHGSHMIVLTRDSRPNRSAYQHAKAVLESYSGATEWHVVDMRRGVWRITPEEARLIASDASEAATHVNSVSEIHM